MFGRRRDADTVVTAQITIYRSGTHHVEFTPHEGIHPIDLVQLAISTFAWVHFLSMDLDTIFAQSLQVLVRIGARDWDFYGGSGQYRDLLAQLTQNLPESLHADGAHSAGQSDSFVTRLVRGKNKNEVDHVLMDFSMWHYKPNLPNSALLLYNAVAHKLDSDHVRVLHMALTYFYPTLIAKLWGEVFSQEKA